MSRLCCDSPVQAGLKCPGLEFVFTAELHSFRLLPEKATAALVAIPQKLRQVSFQYGKHVRMVFLNQI